MIHRLISPYLPQHELAYLTVLLLIYVIINKNTYKDYIIIKKYNLFMFIESSVYALLLLFLLNGFYVFNNNDYISYENFLMNFYFCIGAGIWEELLFRLIIYNTLIFILSYLFNVNISIIIGVIISSL